MPEENPLTGTRTAPAREADANAPRVPPAAQVPYRAVLLGPTTPFVFAARNEPLVTSILKQNRYGGILERARELGGVRRVLDLGAGEGAFAAWCYLQWQGCWVDMVEYDPELARYARRNAPPGASLLEPGKIDAGVYDLVRVATWGPLGDPIALLVALRAVPMLIVDIVEAPTPEEREARAEAAREAAKQRWRDRVAETQGPAGASDG